MRRTSPTLPTRSAVALLAATAVAVLAATPFAAAAEEPAAANVALTVTVVGGPEVGERSYTLLCGGDGSPTELHDGVRVPIPTTSFDADGTAGSGVVPIVSYQYQDVGFRLSAATKLLSDGRVEVRARIESSTVRASGAESAGEALPEVVTLSRHVRLVLAAGVPVTALARSVESAAPLEVRLRADLAE